MNVKVKYKDVEDAYKQLFPNLTRYARRLLINKDDYIDAVNDAFVLVLQWQKKNPGAHIAYRLVFKKVQRVCNLRNRRLKTVSVDDPALASYFRSM